MPTRPAQPPWRRSPRRCWSPTGSSRRTEWTARAPSTGPVGTSAAAATGDNRASGAGGGQPACGIGPGYGPRPYAPGPCGPGPYWPGSGRRRGGPRAARAGPAGPGSAGLGRAGPGWAGPELGESGLGGSGMLRLGHRGAFLGCGDRRSGRLTAGPVRPVPGKSAKAVARAAGAVAELNGAADTRGPGPRWGPGPGRCSRRGSAALPGVIGRPDRGPGVGLRSLRPRKERHLLRRGFGTNGSMEGSGRFRTARVRPGPGPASGAARAGAPVRSDYPEPRAGLRDPGARIRAGIRDRGTDHLPRHRPGPAARHEGRRGDGDPRPGRPPAAHPADGRGRGVHRRGGRGPDGLPAAGAVPGVPARRRRSSGCSRPAR